MLILPSLINRFNEVSVKFPAGFFFLIDTDIFKILQKGKGTSIDKTILKRKTGLTFPDFKTHYVSTLIKKVWY